MKKLAASTGRAASACPLASCSRTASTWARSARSAVMPPAVPCLPGSATVSSTRASLRPMMTALPPPATTPAAVPLPMPLLPPATTTLQPSKLPVIPGSPPMAESPGFSRVVRRPLAGVALESGFIAGGRRGARRSGGAPDHRALVVVDQVAPDSVRAAAQDVAGRAVEVHVLAVGTGAVDCPVQDDQGDVVVGEHVARVDLQRQAQALVGVEVGGDVGVALDGVPVGLDEHGLRLVQGQQLAELAGVEPLDQRGGHVFGLGGGFEGLGHFGLLLVSAGLGYDDDNPGSGPFSPLSLLRPGCLAGRPRKASPADDLGESSFARGCRGCGLLGQPRRSRADKWTIQTSFVNGWPEQQRW